MYRIFGARGCRQFADKVYAIDHMYEVADTCLINPYDNPVKNQSDNMAETEEEQMFMLDVVVTVVYEADADRTGYIYSEQDGMGETLCN